MHILDHFELHPLVKLELFGIDMSITKAVIMMWIACFLIVLIMRLAGRNAKLVPTGFQNFIELIIDLLRERLVIDMIGEKGMKYFPFIATMFLFILFCNLLGLIPGAYTATSKISVTAALAIMVFFTYHIVGIIEQGFIKYIKHFLPPGIPLWIIPIMLPIEIVSHFARPFSLAVRLFANMMAGHIIILVFLSLIIYFKSYIIAPVPLLGATLMCGLEILFSLIQAYIFSALTAMYIATAIKEGH